MKTAFLLYLFAFLFFLLPPSCLLKGRSVSLHTVPYYKGLSDELETEVVPFGAALSDLYRTWAGRRFIKPFMTNKWCAELYALYQKRSFTTKSIEPFVKEYGIDLEEYEVPYGGFKSFESFFTRSLKAGARQVDENPQSLISPVDGKLLAIENITAQTIFPIKGGLITLKTLLESKERAALYEGGSMLICRLAPRDYHHFHLPLAAIPFPPRKIKGGYESVSPLTFTKTHLPFCTNRRTIIPFTFGKKQGDMVAVGALLVGRIITTYAPYEFCEKGKDVGFFTFGGSSVVFLFPKGTVSFEKALMEHSAQGIESCFKMGELIGTIIS